jgi:hypothetical protein
LPDISTINGVDIATLASFGGVAFADGQTLDGQNVSLVSGAHTFISSQTASSSSSLSFTSGIDSTYDVYEWHFINMHPATNAVTFQFQVNAAGGSGFNEIITSTFFRAYLLENNSNQGLDYRSSYDQAQGTGYQPLTEGVAGSTGFNDSSASGVLTLYAPSSTTYVKHFASRGNWMGPSPVSVDTFVGGYINTMSAIDEIDFKFSSGNIDAGEIRMYGVATS